MTVYRIHDVPRNCPRTIYPQLAWISIQTLNGMIFWAQKAEVGIPTNLFPAPERVN